MYDLVAHAKRVFTKHGAKANGKVEPAYRSWGMMKNRCLNKNAMDYKYYGGRGIKVCESWLSYENFIKDMGIPAKGLTLERVDSNGNYEPSNCRWATRLEQARNREYCKQYTLGSETKYAAEWASEFKIDTRLFYTRYKKHKENPNKYTELWVKCGGR